MAKNKRRDRKKSVAPATCHYCDGHGNSTANGDCGFCDRGKPLDTQQDWDESWGVLFND